MADTAAVSPLPWRAYLLVGSLAVLSYPLLPHNPLRGAWYLAIALAAVTATVVAVGHYRPAAAGLWYALASSHALPLGGIAIYIVMGARSAVPARSLAADAFFLAGHLLLLGTMLVVIHRRVGGRDTVGLLDAGVACTGFLLLSWVFVFQPVWVAGGRGSLLTHLLTISYPLFGVLLLVLTTRLLLAGASQSPTWWLITLALVAQFTGGMAYALWALHGAWPMGTSEAIFLIAYVLWGTAALHPSMTELASKVTGLPRWDIGRGRLVLLACASMAAPAVLLVQVLREGEVRSPLVIAGASAVTSLLVIARLSGLVQQVRAQAARLEGLAHIDGLTGIPNRRAWEAELARALAGASRSGAPLHAVLIDLDHFKRFNDHHGHIEGDRLLQEAAQAWRACLRGGDFLARYGGEEFGLLLEGCTLSEAMRVIERLRAATPAGQTLSAGIASWDGLEPATKLVARADLALYQAKRGGRNRVVVAPPPLPGQRGGGEPGTPAARR